MRSLNFREDTGSYGITGGTCCSAAAGEEKHLAATETIPRVAQPRWQQRDLRNGSLAALWVPPPLHMQMGMIWVAQEECRLTRKSSHWCRATVSQHLD